MNSGLPSHLSTEINRTLIFCHVVKYRLLCGKITRSLHGPRRTEHNDTAAYHLRDSLASELADWHRETQNLDIFPQSLPSLSSQSRSSFLSKDWHEVIYHN